MDCNTKNTIAIKPLYNVYFITEYFISKNEFSVIKGPK